MAKIRRDGPCSCGSGKKAKRCCHGPAAAVDRLLPLDIAEDAVSVLRRMSLPEIRAHFDELFDLPALDLSLQITLPRFRSADVEHALVALQYDDEDTSEVLQRVVQELDTPERRIDLARAVITLRDQETISPELAVLALFDLDRRDSVVFESSVAESLQVLAGDHRTPGGLLVAAR